MTKSIDLEVDLFFKPGTTWKAVCHSIVSKLNVQMTVSDNLYHCQFYPQNLKDDKSPHCATEAGPSENLNHLLLLVLVR